MAIQNALRIIPSTTLKASFTYGSEWCDFWDKQWHRWNFLDHSWDL